MALHERRAWSGLLAVGIPFWKSDRRYRAWGLLAAIVGLLLSLNGLNVVNSYVGRGFMTAVAERESARYYRDALLYVGVFAASTLVAVLQKFAQDRLALSWRLWLSRHFIEGYLEHQAYFHIKAEGIIDNPDQRISEDTKTFTETLVSFVLMVANSAVTAVAFASVLWLITPWLLGAAVAYAALGSLTTICLGRRLPGLDNRQLVKEAELRYALVRIREYAAPIALLQGEGAEGARLVRRLRNLGENFRQIIAVNRNLGFFTSGYNYLVQIIPVMIVAPRYMRGEIEFGEVTQSAMAFAQILGALSLVVAQFQAISSFAAVVNRLGGIEHAIRESIRERASGPPTIRVIEDETRIAYDRLTLRTPHEGAILIDNLSLEVRKGMRLLIFGNGAGKSALFHATAGLWDAGAGTVIRPSRQNVMFLIERPYLAPGTLRDQFHYGPGTEEYADVRLAEALEAVGLAAIVERFGGFDAERDWANTLSEGEQQLLAVARLLVVRPPFALLDYAVSGLDAAHACDIYKVLAQTTITYLTIGDRHLLESYHDNFLELVEGGRWRMQAATRESVAPAGR